MTVELNTSTAYVNKTREAQYFQVEQEQAPVVVMSLAEKETLNLARIAERGDSLWDKAVLNLVHPPALMLFALLDSGRKVAAPPLKQVQDAYDTVTSAAKELGKKTQQSTPAVPDAVKTPAAESPSTIPAPSQTTTSQAQTTSQAKTVAIATVAPTATAPATASISA